MARLQRMGRGDRMRRIRTVPHKRRKVHLRAKLLILAVAVVVCWFNTYVNAEIRPTLMQLAEYQAKAITVGTIHTAVQSVWQKDRQATANLCQVTQDCVKLDMGQANRVRLLVLEAVEQEMEKVPQQSYKIPFGSLTGNALLSGHGPGWRVDLRPEGYVGVSWQETTESLSINVTRYCAQLEICVTVNMILDGRTETLDVCETVPMVSILLRGDTPQTYAAVSD